MSAVIAVPRHLQHCTGHTLNTANFETNGEMWEKVLRKLRKREMPPAGAPRPDAATYDEIVASIETERDRRPSSSPIPAAPRSIASTGPNTPTPCATCWRSRSTSPSSLPADDIGYGFDNIGDVLYGLAAAAGALPLGGAQDQPPAVGDPSMPVSYSRPTRVRTA